MEPEFVNVYISNQKKWIEDLVAKQVMFETRVQLAESKISQLTEQLSEATRKNEEFTEDLASTKYKLEEQLELNVLANREKENLSSQIANMTRESSKFQDLLTNAKMDVSKGTDKIHMLHKQIDELVDINRQHQTDVEKLIENNAHLASENTRMSSELYDLKNINNGATIVMGEVVSVVTEPADPPTNKKKKSEHSDTTS